MIAPQGVLDAVDRGVEVPAYTLEKASQVVEVHRTSVANAIEAGVKIAMGTDSGVTPHGPEITSMSWISRIESTR